MHEDNERQERIPWKEAELGPVWHNDYESGDGRYELSLQLKRGVTRGATIRLIPNKHWEPGSRQPEYTALIADKSANLVLDPPLPAYQPNGGGPQNYQQQPQRGEKAPF